MKTTPELEPLLVAPEYFVKYGWREVGVRFVPVYEPTDDGADVRLLYRVEYYDE